MEERAREERAVGSDYVCFKILVIFVVIPQQCVTVKCFICQLHSCPQTALGLVGHFTVAFFSPFPPRLPVAGVESSQLYQLHHGNKNTLTCYSEDRAHYPAGAPRSFADWGLASTCMKLHTKALEKHLNQLTQTVQKSICHNCYYCLNSYNNSGSLINQPVNKLKSSTRKGPTFLCCPGCRDQ